MKMEFESYFDAMIQGNEKSESIIIPADTIEKLNLGVGEIIEVAIRKNKSKEEKK